MAIFKRAKVCRCGGINMAVQCSGLSMRDIYTRYVNTGELSVLPHPGSYGNTELTAFRPDMDPSDAIELAHGLYDMQVAKLKEVQDAEKAKDGEVDIPADPVKPVAE